MSNPRYANGHRRRKLRQRILNEETHCAICGHPVDVTLTHGHDASPEIHELIPLSRGGNPLDRDNCRLTHRACNRAQGNRLPGEQHTPRDRQRAAAAAPLKTSRNWLNPHPPPEQST